MPGRDITFFEYPGVPSGRAGAGMIHRVVWRVAGPEALDFWAERLADARPRRRRARGQLVFDDPEGLTHELRADDTTDAAADRQPPRDPAGVRAPGLPRGPRVRGRPGAQRPLLEETLSFAPVAVGPTPDRAYEVRGEHRGGFYLYDAAAGRAPAPGRRHGPPRRVCLPAEEHEALARTGDRTGPAHPTPSSTATTSARSTSASPRACCSRSRRSDRDSPSTSRSSSSARSCR